MPSKLPENIKSRVIQQWLAGAQRDKIAVDNGISAGAVTSMVNEWRRALGSYESDELRELAVTLRKNGIIPAKCASGFRVAMMMSRLGVQEDNFESFMSEVYNRCNDLGLTPQLISSYITSLLEYSQSVPFSQIRDHISEMIEEKKRLEQEIEKLRNQVETLQNQKSEAEHRSKVALDNHRITEDKLQWYTGIKNELKNKYGSPVDNITKFASMVNAAGQHFGYDIHKISNEISHLELLRTECSEFQVWNVHLKNEYHNLSRQNSEVRQMLQAANQSLSIYGEIYAMGIGLEELKLLHDTILEIAEANNIPRAKAINKFFADFREQYDGKLGFEAKKEKLQIEVSQLREELNLIPFVGLSLARLVQNGVQERDIVAIAELFNTDESNTSIEHIQTIIDNVRNRRSTNQGRPETLGELKTKEEKEALDSFQQMQKDIFDSKHYYVP